MSKFLPIWFVAALVAGECFGQNNSTILSGKVTFTTSANVYVRFGDTQKIAIGDTLWRMSNGALIPILIVTNKSSSSCVTSAISGYEAIVGDLIVFKLVPATEKKEKSVEGNTPKQPVSTDRMQRSGKAIRGSISASSYSSISSLRDDTHRTMYRLSLRAPQLFNSKFSFETYLNYRQTFLTNDSVTFRKQSDIFDVYNLAIRYDASPTLSFTAGRRINPKMSSVGAIDGLQVEKFFGNFFTGIIVGFRPDVIDYGFNSDLLQYGAYFGIKTDHKVMYSETTLGLMEQTNNGTVDRRYTYFQHSSTIGGKLNLFSSIELDLYSVVDEVASNEPRLTSLYVSAGYRFGRKADLTLSYDTRKQIMYYETFKTEIERLLEDDIARQGIRARLNVRPLKNVSAGVSYSTRFQSNHMNNSDNINGYVSVSGKPAIGGRFNANYNRNSSNYMVSHITSFRYSRTIVKDKLEADGYFRMAGYYYLNSEVTNRQKYYGASLYYWIARKLVFSILGELAAFASEENYRINARIVKNF